MRSALALLVLAACSTDFVAPEDERCTLYVAEGEAADITRWQIEHCASVRVIVVKLGGTALPDSVAP
jgi:hypothetical protein